MMEVFRLFSLPAAIILTILTLHGSGQARGPTEEPKAPIVHLAFYKTQVPLGPTEAVEAEVLRILRASGKLEVLPTFTEIKAAMESGETLEMGKADYLIGYSLNGFARKNPALKDGADIPLCDQMEQASKGGIRVVDAQTGAVQYADGHTLSQEQKPACSPALSAQDMEQMKLAISRVIARKLVLALFPAEVVELTPSGDVVLNYGAGFFEPGQKLALYGPEISMPDPTGRGQVQMDGEFLGEIAIIKSDGTRAMARRLSRADADIPEGTTVRLVE